MSSDLDTYLIQLQQVEAALTNDPSNDDLLKLKSDLEEVIVLTQELEAAPPSGADAKGAPHLSSATSPDSSEDEDSGSGSEGREESAKKHPPQDPLLNKPWCIGDPCYAPWSKDGKLNAASVTHLLPDGKVTVTFDGYSVFETCDLAKLQRPSQVPEFVKQKARKSQFDMLREKKKKKNAKRNQKLKDLEEQRESEKSGWQNFSKKIKRGMTKKSIFSTPESALGKVGIGTCGMGGKAMTHFLGQGKFPQNGRRL